MASDKKPLTLNYLLNARRYLLLTIVAAVLAVGLFLIATLAQVQAVINLQGQKGIETEKLTNLQAKVQQLNAVNDPQIAEQNELVNLLLPNKKPLLELLNSLSVVSSNTQVSLRSFELSPGEIATNSAEITDGVAASGGTGPTQVLSLDFIAQGSLGQLNQFITALEQTTPLITITKLTLNSGGELKARDRTLEQLLSEPYRAEMTVEAAYFTQTLESSLDTKLPEISQSHEQILSELRSFTKIITPSQTEVVGGGLQDLFGTQFPELEQK